MYSFQDATLTHSYQKKISAITKITSDLVCTYMHIKHPKRNFNQVAV